MNKQQQHTITTLVVPQIKAGNRAAAGRIIDHLIRSAMSNKSKQALEAWKAANI